MSTDAWRTTLLSPSATIQDAIRCLDETGLQIVMVVGDDQTMIGTVTDGDIRRGMLRGEALESSVGTILHRDPLVVPPKWNQDTVLQMMQANRVHQLPVVDERRHVIGLFLWDELMAPGIRENPMIIMAGGRGTRLGSHTANCPKPLLPIGDSTAWPCIVR